MGYSIGARTAQMTYAELVHSGVAMINGNLVWLVPSLLVLFVGYVLVTKKIMATSPQANPVNEK